MHWLKCQIRVLQLCQHLLLETLHNIMTMIFFNVKGSKHVSIQLSLSDCFYLLRFFDIFNAALIVILFNYVGRSRRIFLGLCPRPRSSFLFPLFMIKVSWDC